MQVLRDAIANKNLIEVLISKYGTASEHNYYCYYIISKNMKSLT